MSWLQGKAPAELHLFQNGGHGFGGEQRGRGSDQWLQLLNYLIAGYGKTASRSPLRRSGESGAS